MSIMEMFSCYCRSCDRNSICWLTFEINLHQLLAMATDEVSGDVMMGGQCLTYFCWSDFNMFVMIVVIQKLLNFCCVVLFSLFFRGGMLVLVLADWLLLLCQIWNIHKLIVGYCSFQANLYCAVPIEKFSVLMKIWIIYCYFNLVDLKWILDDFELSTFPPLLGILNVLRWKMQVPSYEHASLWVLE
jgi:hypothetical protein